MKKNTKEKNLVKDVEIRELAIAIDNFMFENDFYTYYENEIERSKNIDLISSKLKEGNSDRFIKYIEEVAKNGDTTNSAIVLIERIYKL